MPEKRKQLLRQLDRALLGRLVRWLYPQYYRPKYGYAANFHVLRHYALTQKILRINGKAGWPVHFTSRVSHPDKIKKGILVDPGDMPGCYLNAANGIIMGSNIEIGPGAKIISANHDPQDYRRHLPAPPIRIGNHVWIGANVVILPGVRIGSNVIIGAGAVVTGDIPDNSVAAGNPCRVIREKAPYPIDLSSMELNRPNPLAQKHKV